MHHMRYISAGEKMYLGSLIAEYGDDVEAMAKDRKKNPEQRTAGELGRSIRKAGGVEEIAREK
jgi:nucleolar protein 16